MSGTHTDAMRSNVIRDSVKSMQIDPGHYANENPPIALDLRHRVIRDRSAPGYYDIRDQTQVKLNSFQQRANGAGWFRDFPCEEYGMPKEILRADWNSPSYLEAWHLFSPQKTAILIQDWLYFALLGEVLGRFVEYNEFIARVRPPIEIQDLKDTSARCIIGPSGEERHQISTNRFFNDEWKTWPRMLVGLDDEDRKARVEEIMNALHQARKFCLLEDSGQLSHIPFISELALSIRTLGLLFEDVCCDHPSLFPVMRRGLGTEIWGQGSLLRQRMSLTTPGYLSHEPIVHSIKQSWCPNDIARQSRVLPATAMYYMSSMSVPMDASKEAVVARPLTEKSKDHTSCTEQSCFMDNIEVEKYDTEHFSCCDGTCGLVGPDIAKVEEVLRRGHIPLIRFLPAGPRHGLFTNIVRDMQLVGQSRISAYAQALALSENIKYHQPAVAAYGPEWAPKYTAKSLGLLGTYEQLSLNELEWEFEVLEYKPGDDTPSLALSHVWSDGLGDTKGNKLPRCRMTFLQRAIWLGKTPVSIPNSIPDSHFDENGRSVMECEDTWAWVEHNDFKRLINEPVMPFWLDTFCVPRTSEAARTEALRLMGRTYAAASSVLVLDQEFCGSSIGGHGLIRKSRALTNVEAVARILASRWMRRLWTLQEGLLAKKLLLLFSEGAVDIDHIIAGVKQYADNNEPGHVAAGQLARGLESMIDFKEVDLYGRLIRVWNASIGRTTSRPGDVPICMASTIGLDAGVLHTIPAEHRVTRFYTLLEEIPQSIIFSGAEKLTEPGFRWADRYLATEFLETQSAQGRIRHDSPCLEVTYNTYFLNLNLSDRIHSLILEAGQNVTLTVGNIMDATRKEGAQAYLILLERPCIYKAEEHWNPIKIIIFTQTSQNLLRNQEKPLKNIRAYLQATLTFRAPLVFSPRFGLLSLLL
ncbi:hypothetical protein C7974DRAFT_387100 [Boeremia exigua]|uniref:uncharacterized protein n=1 Tax=Boeremia exigua TaxID=749465 RepID=UPI001E8E852D|nr:uncharacterized protein C7974DRAFT_387100 [Boeremia exigua]KAH6643241.1 hypothetical protein C7974DRAFT_387100 [Boeremia exigua]